MKLPPEAMEQFVDAWKDFDREASNYMDTKNLRKLLFKLDGPYGFADYKPDANGKATMPPPKEVTAHLTALDIRDLGGKVGFHDVLEAIGRYVQEGESTELPVGSEVERSLRQKYSDVLKTTGLHKHEVSEHSSAYIFNVIRMQMAFRRSQAHREHSHGRSHGHRQERIGHRPKAGSPTPALTTNGANGLSTQQRVSEARGPGLTAPPRRAPSPGPGSMRGPSPGPGRGPSGARKGTGTPASSMRGAPPKRGTSSNSRLSSKRM